MATKINMDRHIREGWTVGAFIRELAPQVEVFNNYHDTTQIGYFAPLVQRRGALMTCGSDFHGKTKPLIGIGQFRFDDRFESYLRASAARLLVLP